MRILAAMSGGVDSAVAAARLVDAGHDVTGVHLALSKNPESYRSGARGCCLPPNWKRSSSATPPPSGWRGFACWG